MSAPARSIEETAISTSRCSITCSIGRRCTSTSNIDFSNCVGVQALRHGQVALWVEVDEQHLEALLRERDAEVQRRRRLRDAALLIREHDHLRFRRRRHARRANVGTRKEARETHVQASSVRSTAFLPPPPEVSRRRRPRRRRPRPAPTPRPPARARAARSSSSPRPRPAPSRVNPSIRLSRSSNRAASSMPARYGRRCDVSVPAL